MLKRQKQIEINSDVLFNISVKLLDHYYIEPNLNFLLLLSYLTVKEFSRNMEHLDKNAKMDLCLKYTPDLLSNLAQAEIIDVQTSIDMKKKFIENDTDMKGLLEVYSIIFTYKDNKTVVKPTKCCFK